MFLASVSFFVTFTITRMLTHAFRSGLIPFEGLELGGTRVHHLVWGILLLLVVGYGWLIQIGTGHGQTSIRASRFMAMLYGLGAALTLDEYALWLNLEDVYWEREGRASIDAVIIFGALVSVGLWGGPFFRATTRQIARVWGWRPGRARRKAREAS